MTQTSEDRLGAIGDLHFVIQNARIEDDLLVVAGDNLLLFELADFVKHARERGLAIAVKDVKTRELARLYGVVTLDKDGRVVDFEEKPAVPQSTLISIGLYYFPGGQVAMIRRYIEEGHNRDAPGYLIQWLHREASLYAYVIKGQWFDIGNIDSYNKANELYGM
jgi:glucose-1-phosphate thymidylyltransferase